MYKRKSIIKTVRLSTEDQKMLDELSLYWNRANSAAIRRSIIIAHAQMEKSRLIPPEKEKL